jgi:hypothetical protein
MVISLKGLKSENDYADEGQQHKQKKDPSSRPRDRPNKNKTVTVTE